MAPKAPEIVFGTAGMGMYDDAKNKEFLETLEKHGVKALDTAYIYQGSEAVLGKLGAPKKFIIQTKAPALSPGAMAKKNILEGWEKQRKELGVDQVDLYYFHGPDPSTPVRESLEAIQELYAAGHFKRFGLSNFQPTDVEEIYNIQKEANSVLPSVFQGNYNAVSRHIEEDLFPVLRKLNIAFYAYSPIAGGFLVKDPAALKAKSLDGRWGTDSFVGNLYNTIYGKESLISALDDWGHIASEAGITKAALAYRWIAWHSALKAAHGDAVIIGASKIPQLEETIKAIEAGPLDEKTAAGVEAIWSKVKHEAPRDNYHDYMSKQ